MSVQAIPAASAEEPHPAVLPAPSVVLALRGSASTSGAGSHGLGTHVALTQPTDAALLSTAAGARAPCGALCKDQEG